MNQHDLTIVEHKGEARVSATRRDVVFRLKPSDLQEIEKTLKQRKDFLSRSDTQQAKYAGFDLSENDVLLTMEFEEPDDSVVTSFKGSRIEFILQPTQY